ncbi:MAG: hypothetical protein ACOX4U_05610 [Anaerovoracaceae bacterium]|jgi:hypothetical protein
MKPIKKAGILIGATFGGIVGGVIAIAGHVTGKRFLDDLGGNIVDSTILTGEIAGDAVSGAAHLAVGGMEAIGESVNRKKGNPKMYLNIKKKRRHLCAAKRDLKSAGNRVLGNMVRNFKMTVNSGEAIVQGVLKGDKEGVKREIKTLGKIIAVGAITVGAIKVDSHDEDQIK